MSPVTATPNHQPSWLPSGSAPALRTAPSWFTELQDKAERHYQQLGLPGIRDEQWRYTSLRALKSAELTFATGPLNEARLPDSDLPRLVFVNGYFNALQSDLAGLPEGLLCTNLANALEHHADRLEEVLGTTLPDEAHGFQLLNSAYCRDGYVLFVEQGTVIDTPIEVIFQNDAGVASHCRNLVVAQANSQCTIIERHSSTQPENTHDVYLNNCLTEVVAGQGAHVDHYKLQSESSEAFHIGGIFIDQANGAQVTSHNIGLSGKLLRNDVVARLNGSGSHIEMNGLVLGSDQEHMDNHTEVVHAVPNCTSDEFYKTVLDDHSRSVFRGRIIVAQDAQQTNADQQNNNLLLSPNAEADTKPQLEIYADDVKCSHGATVGQLEQKSLFYLQSRGINIEAARALLTFAFANEVVERIKVDSIKQELTQLIAGELMNDIEGVL